jgi:hypothetical protein
MTDPNERAKVLFRIIEQTSDGKTREDIVEDNILRPYYEAIEDTIERINGTLECGAVKNSDVHHNISTYNKKRLITLRDKLADAIKDIEI